MSHAWSLASSAAPIPADAGRYRPGVCNIGPAEITRRRRAGHVGAIISVVLLGVLVAISAPPLARLLIALPAAAAASGYLQARLHFCAGFAARGVFNFGPPGRIETVTDPAAHARDRAMARRIGAASVAVGALFGLLAVLLPL